MALAREPNRRLTFPILMSLALLAALLPAGWTGWLRALVQVVGFPQWTFLSVARDMQAEAAPVEAISPEVFTRLQGENAALRRQLQQQDLWLRDLQEQLTEVTGVRAQFGGAAVKILVAPVLGYDASPRREALHIGRGSLEGVREGQWVAAGIPPQRHDPQATGRQLLLRQWLVGQIAEVDTHTSRLRLASDSRFGAPLAGEPVVLGRLLPDGRCQLSETRFVLRGLGRGQMVIERADADYMAEGYRLVLAPPSPTLPAAMLIGEIQSSRRLDESALHYDLVVEPAGDVQRLRFVYVIRVGE